MSTIRSNHPARGSVRAEADQATPIDKATDADATAVIEPVAAADPSAADQSATGRAGDAVAREQRHDGDDGGACDSVGCRTKRVTLLTALGWTRLVAIIPALGLFVGSLSLAISALERTGAMVMDFIHADIDSIHIAVELIEIADFFLLSVAICILALGLLRLFVANSVVLPSWLSFGDFGDLEERLASVITSMLGVYFLGQVLQGRTGEDLLVLGVASAVIMVGLAVFLRTVSRMHASHEDGAQGTRDPRAR